MFICCVNIWCLYLVGKWVCKARITKWVETGLMIKTLKYLKWLKNSFLFTYDSINNIQQALVFLLCTRVLNIQANLPKHFIHKINFLLPQKISKRNELKLLWSNLICLKKNRCSIERINIGKDVLSRLWNAGRVVKIRQTFSEDGCYLSAAQARRCWLMQMNFWFLLHPWSSHVLVAVSWPHWNLTLNVQSKKRLKILFKEWW